MGVVMSATRERSYAIRLGLVGAGAVVTSFKQVGDAGKTAMTTVGGATEKTGAQLAAFGTHISQYKTALAGLAAAVTGGGFVVALKGAVDYAAAVQNIATQTGFAAEAVQTLRFAGEQAGLEFEAVDDSLKTFSEKIGEAVRGEGELLPLLEAANVSLADSDGRLRSVNDLFRDFSDVLKNAGSDQERLAMAIVAFGDEGAGLVNVLRDGSGALDSMASKARALGRVMSAETIHEAALLNREIDTLLHSLRSNFQRGVLEGLTGGLQSVSDLVTSPEFQAGIKAMGDNLGSLFRFMVENKDAVLAVTAGLSAAAVVPGSPQIKAVVGLATGAATANALSKEDKILAEAERLRQLRAKKQEIEGKFEQLRIKNQTAPIYGLDQPQHKMDEATDILVRAYAQLQQLNAEIAATEEKLHGLGADLNSLPTKPAAPTTPATPTEIKPPKPTTLILADAPGVPLPLPAKPARDALHQQMLADAEKLQAEYETYADVTERAAERLEALRDGGYISDELYNQAIADRTATTTPPIPVPAQPARDQTDKALTSEIQQLQQLTTTEVERNQLERERVNLLHEQGLVSDQVFARRTAQLDDEAMRLSTIGQTLTDIGQAAARGFMDWASGAATAADAVRDLESAIAAMIMQRFIADPLMDVIGGAVSGWAGSLWGGGSTLSSAAKAVGAAVAVNHTGGVVGGGYSGNRMMAIDHPFAQAPRYHSGGIAGLAPDERPAILRLHEEVLTRDDPRHRYNGGGRANPQVSVNQYNTWNGTTNRAEVEAMLAQQHAAIMADVPAAVGRARQAGHLRKYGL